MRRVLFGSAVSVVLLATWATVLRAEDKPAAEAPSAGEPTYAEIELKGSYHEGAQLPGLFGDLTESLDTAIARLDKAAGDSKVGGVILHVNSPTIGWSKMNAFRMAIARVQA